jgi:8-oxo-dGTP diphosphatase
MWKWAGEQAKAEEEGRILEKKLFLPLVNLWRTRPEMEKVLEGQ